MITLIIKLENEEKSVVIESRNLSILVNDVRLYKKDKSFIKSFLNAYAIGDFQRIASNEGIIVIDLENNFIYDAQMTTGIFKMSPSEIRSSKNGMLVAETKENNILKRFRDAVISHRLKGFESWDHSGTRIDKEILESHFDDPYDMLANVSDYGQFVFDTTPFRVEMLDLNDALEASTFIKYLETHFDLDEEEQEYWENKKISLREGI